MIFDALLVSALLSVLPISELRGGLPYALARGVPLIPAYLVCVLANALVGPLGFLFLSTLHGLFERWPPYRRFFERIIERSRKRVHRQVEKYGYAGLILFVAIPLPITGAYTGTLGAWVLGMDWRKALPALVSGVILAGIIVSTVYLLGIKALDIFIK